MHRTACFENSSSSEQHLCCAGGLVVCLIFAQSIFDIIIRLLKVALLFTLIKNLLLCYKWMLICGRVLPSCCSVLLHCAVYECTDFNSLCYTSSRWFFSSVQRERTTFTENNSKDFDIVPALSWNKGTAQAKFECICGAASCPSSLHLNGFLNNLMASSMPTSDVRRTTSHPVWKRPTMLSLTSQQHPQRLTCGEFRRKCDEIYKS